MGKVRYLFITKLLKQRDRNLILKSFHIFNGTLQTSIFQKRKKATSFPLAPNAIPEEMQSAYVMNGYAYELRRYYNEIASERKNSVWTKTMIKGYLHRINAKRFDSTYDQEAACE